VGLRDRSSTVSASAGPGPAGQGQDAGQIADLSLALRGRFGDHHALMCRLHLDQIDHLEAMLARLDAQIEAMMIRCRLPS
jgi:transposase